MAIRHFSVFATNTYRIGNKYNFCNCGRGFTADYMKIIKSLVLIYENHSAVLLRRIDLNVIGEPEHEIVSRYPVRCNNTHCDCCDLALLTHHTVSWSLFITTSLYGFFAFHSPTYNAKHITSLGREKFAQFCTF